MTSARAAAPLTPGDRVVVIGAGPAGLTAAHLLRRKDVHVVVLEADDIVGGIARTVEYKGFRFDIGGHRFFTRIAPVERLWEDILGEDFLTVPRLSRIYYNGRFFDYPLKPFNALRGLGPWKAIRIVLSYVHARFDPSPVEENFEQWVTNRFGAQLYEVFFKTYTEKVWGTPCHEISAEWAAQRIQGMSLAKAILASAPLNRRSTKIKSLIREFRYPRLGPGQMWERCRTLVEQAGHDVRLRHRVRALELYGQRVVAVRVQTPSGDQRLECDHCISTMPLRSLMRTFDPAAPPAARRAGDGLKYRDFLVVVLIVNRAHLFADAVPHAADPLHAIRPTGGDRLGATHRVDLRRAKGPPASSWSTFAYSNSVSISSSPILACSRRWSSSRASGARLFRPACENSLAIKCPRKP